MKPGKMIKQVLQSIFKKPATNMYPYEKLEMPDNIRGKLKFHPEKCTGCKLCMKDCPADAITINKLGEKQFEAVIDLGKCIYCAQCVDTCPAKALEITKNVELAQLDVNKLKVVFRAEPGDNTEKHS
jgi:formate hydrogenlyase subunit 6/NADH:ubiquinone oxidoreductase subunit I